jgi:hypothetical protein
MVSASKGSSAGSTWQSPWFKSASAFWQSRRIMSCHDRHGVRSAAVADGPGHSRDGPCWTGRHDAACAAADPAAQQGGTDAVFARADRAIATEIIVIARR